MFVIVFLILDILVGIKWYVIVVFVFLSPMTNDIERLFMDLPAICMTSLESYVLRSFAH